tara:strand:- start:4898 stop:5401 length:504 start_codon:yes stop_codon:yes gene_type:complete
MEKNLIRAILAHDSQWGIGKDGDLPWPKNSEDLKWFKECTWESVVVMGRNTWDSLPYSFCPLPNRYNVIVSNTLRTLDHLMVEVVKPDIYKSRLNILSSTQDVWIIGGAQLIKSSLDIIDELWLNNVQGDYECDTFLPIYQITELFSPSSWEVKSFGTITKWIKNNV